MKQHLVIMRCLFAVVMSVCLVAYLRYMTQLGKTDIGTKRIRTPVEFPELAHTFIFDGAFWFDGGSISVRLRDDRGGSLNLVFTQNTFPTSDYKPSRLYFGTIHEVNDSRGTPIAAGSPTAVKVASYLETAIKNSDPSKFSKIAYIPEEGTPWPISAAKRLLKIITVDLEHEVRDRALNNTMHQSGGFGANKMDDHFSPPGDC